MVASWSWQGYFTECRMILVSGIECETGRYIIFDKLISYTPNPNPKVTG